MGSDRAVELARRRGSDKLARQAGGFTVESQEPMLIGQVQIIDVPDTDVALGLILDLIADPLGDGTATVDIALNDGQHTLTAEITDPCSNNVASTPATVNMVPNRATSPPASMPSCSASLRLITLFMSRW